MHGMHCVLISINNRICVMCVSWLSSPLSVHKKYPEKIMIETETCTYPDIAEIAISDLRSEVWLSCFYNFKSKRYHIFQLLNEVSR